MKISFFERFLDLIIPRVCSICGRRLSPGEDFICVECNLHLPRTYYAKDAYENEMAKLFWGRIPIERSTALFFYEAGSEACRIIYDLKYNQRPEYGYYLGKMVAQEVQANGFFTGIDLLVPIPLARKRQWQRGYNQSMEIAKGVEEVTHIPIAPHVIRRNKFESSQTHKDRWERMENVSHVFELIHPEKVKDKHVLLIDDVVTTGSTICACGKQLEQAGGVKISVLSIGFAKS